MSDVLISVLFAAGVAGWSYFKLSRRTGYGNTANAWSAAAVIFVLAFGFFLSLLKWVLHV